MVVRDLTGCSPEEARVWRRIEEQRRADTITDLTRQLEIARAALEAIANDPYQHGQRIQKMKSTATQALARLDKREGNA